MVGIAARAFSPESPSSKGSGTSLHRRRSPVIHGGRLFSWWRGELARWDARAWDRLGERWPLRTVVANGLIEGLVVDLSGMLLTLAVVSALIAWAPAMPR